MSNDYYNASGWPVTLSFGASVSGRSEMASIAAAFDKIVALTGNASKFVRVNSGATAQEAVSASGTGNVVLTAGATLTGATISGSGAFTTLSASSTVSGAGFTSYMASPPAIGGTAPAAGAFTTLSATGLLDLNAAGAGQIKFPVSQNASADANTLDDYEEGTWTPRLTCTTPGTLSIGYSSRSGRYVKIGQLVTMTFEMVISSFSIGSASGNVRIDDGTGSLPGGGGLVPAAASFGALGYQGINKAGGFTQAGLSLLTSGTYMSIEAMGMNLAITSVAISDLALVSGAMYFCGQITFRNVS